VEQERYAKARAEASASGMQLPPSRLPPSTTFDRIVPVGMFEMSCRITALSAK
jgi:hypothetical protein